MKVIELEGVENVRDLGGTPVAGGRSLRYGLLYRGSALVKASDDDLQMLFGQLGISCVVDLRCGWEVERGPDLLPDGVAYLHIPFYDLEKVGIEYTAHAPGTKVVDSDFACEPAHFYRSLANRLTAAQMRDGLAEILERAGRGEPVYFHCSGGKDRAGIMALLVLSALGASREDVLDDYLFTNVSRDAHYQQNLARFLKLADGDEKRAVELVASHRAEPANIDAFYEAIDAEYGSWHAFEADVLGLSEARKIRVRDACVG